ncbi:uncharacterized protein LOC124134461 [Haliotis rufescens]|uniref:uncharacterized protein LOC124134461 n=1 Tax=Haliotis rufescens TaxID=6454 RepID=UPI00201EBF8F|nr:uncharacterized protein LOC124134461 [Haliotis rufescens]
MPDNEGCNLFFKRKTKTQIKFVLKLGGITLIIYYMLHQLSVRNTLSHFPVEALNIHESEIENALRHFADPKKDPQVPLRDCPIPRLISRHGNPSSSNDTQSAHCRRVPPVRGSCDIADSLFKDQPKGTCSQQGRVQICDFQGNPRRLICKKTNCDKLHLGTRSLDTGVLKWREVASTDMLQSQIVDLLKTPHSGYCYIRCEQSTVEVNVEYPDFLQESSDTQNVQLLILPPLVPGNKKYNRASPSINVNFIFIDSVSRHHFFRSLPKTIKLFDRLNTGKNAVVLDFELVQAVRSRTFETLSSLFQGNIPQEDQTFGVLDMPPEALKIEGLFGLFRDAGYCTLWLEDLCFEWEWGISKDLLVHNKSLSTEETWKSLRKAFSKAGIESFGVSTASCEILNQNGVNDHFHGPDTVCFNGRHQHEYLLDYLKLYQDMMAATSKPYVTFLETNVGHEDTGRRVQTMDDHLAEYLAFAANQRNTLTVVFSDHGNAYGKFLDESPEGRVELYHPALFMIVPTSVAKQLGQDKMAALTLNQDRLVSHLDLHYTIRSLISSTSNIPEVNKQYLVNPMGLFRNMSDSRQCLNVPQIPPNFCICEGGESRVKNNTLHVVYAHFAVGTMNNAIQTQFHQAHPRVVTGFGSCRRLRLAMFQHVRKAVHSDKTVSLTMDLLFETGDPSYPHHEVFMVSVQSNNGQFVLNKFDRLSPYSKYSVCADKGVQLQLCICNIGDHQVEMERLPPLSDAGLLRRQDLLMHASIVKVKESEDCLYRMNQENEDGLTVSMMNVCSTTVIHVSVAVDTVGMEALTGKSVQADLRPGEIRFLFAGVAKSVKTWNWSYQVQFTLNTWP